MKKLIRLNLMLMILLASINIGAQYSIISGLVTNSKTNEPLILGTVTLYSKGELVAYAETDFEGRYCLLYTSPSPRDATLSRMPSSA